MHLFHFPHTHFVSRTIDNPYNWSKYGFVLSSIVEGNAIPEVHGYENALPPGHGATSKEHQSPPQEQLEPLQAHPEGADQNQGQHGLPQTQHHLPPGHQEIHRDPNSP
jgi:hypothetical protein